MTQALALDPVEGATPARLTTFQKLVWAVALFSLPFYMFRSGLPQPSDGVLMLLLIGPAVASLRESRAWDPRLRSPWVAVAMFVLVIVVVNSMWTLLTLSSDFMKTTSFYLFNLVVFAGIVTQGVRFREEFVRVTAWIAALSLGLQFVLALLYPGLAESSRLILFFNNPNQLAYFAVASCTVVLVADIATPMPRWLIWLTAAMGAFIVYKTYSRAALVGIGVLALVSLMKNPGVVLALAMPALVAAAYFEYDIEDDPMLEMRFAAVREGDVGDYLEDRGLQRIVNNPQYTVLGAGEGEHIRFHPLGIELHSSLANVVFSYGLAGVGCLFWLGFAIAKQMPVRGAALLLPTAFYGLFHNGLRFRMFWLVLAIAVVVGWLSRQQRANRAQALVGGAP